MRPADRAWAVLAVVVLVYEAHAAGRQEWELLSEASDRYRQSHPIAWTGLVVYTAAHLLRKIPAPIDPLHQLAVRLGR